MWLKETFRDDPCKPTKWERFKGPYMKSDTLKQLGADIQSYYRTTSDTHACLWYKRDDTIALTESETNDTLNEFMGRDLKLLINEHCWEVRIIPAC